MLVKEGRETTYDGGGEERDKGGAHARGLESVKRFEVDVPQKPLVHRLVPLARILPPNNEGKGKGKGSETCQERQ
jgi:hypothetical protein